MMELWIMAVVGNLLMPIELHSKTACEDAAYYIANDLSVAVYCVNPETGEIIKHEPEEPRREQ